MAMCVTPPSDAISLYVFYIHTFAVYAKEDSVIQTVAEASAGGSSTPTSEDVASIEMDKGLKEGHRQDHLRDLVWAFSSSMHAGCS